MKLICTGLIRSSARRPGIRCGTRSQTTIGSWTRRHRRTPSLRRGPKYTLSTIAIAPAGRCRHLRTCVAISLAWIRAHWFEISQREEASLRRSFFPAARRTQSRRLETIPPTRRYRKHHAASLTSLATPQSTRNRVQPRIHPILRHSMARKEAIEASRVLRRPL